MYIQVKTEDRIYLYESLSEMDESLRLNNLYPKVLSISEIDREKFNDILRDIACGLRDNKRNRKDLKTQAREMEERKLGVIPKNSGGDYGGTPFQRWLRDFNYKNTMRAISKHNIRYK